MVLSSDYETIYISLIIKWTLLPIVILGIVVQGRSDGGYIRYIPSQNQSLKIILCTNCSRCRLQAASIQDCSIVQ